MNLRHLYHRIMDHIKPFDTKDAVFTVTWRDRYTFLIPGIRKFLEDNGCTYQFDFSGGLCCFKGNNVEINHRGILALAENNYYKSILNYLRHIISQVKHDDYIKTHILI